MEKVQDLEFKFGLSLLAVWPWASHPCPGVRLSLEAHLGVLRFLMLGSSDVLSIRDFISILYVIVSFICDSNMQLRWKTTVWNLKFMICKIGVPHLPDQASENTRDESIQEVSHSSFHILPEYWIISSCLFFFAPQRNSLHMVQT